MADVQRRMDGFLLDMHLRKLNHVQPTLPPKGNLARSVTLRSLWAPSQKSRFVLSAIQARQSTCLQLHSVLSGILRFSNPCSGAGLAMKRAFCAFRIVSLIAFFFFFKFQCSCERLSKGGKFMAQFVSTVTPLNYFTTVGDFSRWPSLPC